jgi:hypothetical protein
LLLIFLILIVGVASCGRQNAGKSSNKDAKLQEQTEGIWTRSTGTNILETTTLVLSNGSFEESTVVKDRSGLHNFHIAGTYQITNGWLIVTTTNSRNPLTNIENISVVSSNQIVRLTDRELVLNTPITNGHWEASYRKEGK